MELGRKRKSQWYYNRFKVDKYFNWSQRQYVRDKNKTSANYSYEIHKYYNWFYIKDINPFHKKDLNTILKIYLGKLDERKRFIIVHHYGLFDNKELSRKQMAMICKVSSERIRQITNQALRRLRYLIKTGEFTSDIHNLKSFLN